MSSTTHTYDLKATKSLRVALGGHPKLASLPTGLSNKSHLKSQTDAADRAFLREGMSQDGSHHERIDGFHPLHNSFRLATQTKAERVTWVNALKQDMYDAVCDKLMYQGLHLVTDIS